MSMKWLAAILICFTVHGLSVAASFDCNKARTATEKRICANPDISSMDAALGKLYGRALKNSDDPKSLRAEEIRWLEEVRNKCADDACLTKAYEARISVLKPTGVSQSGNAAKYQTTTTAAESTAHKAASVKKVPEPDSQLIRTQAYVSGFSVRANQLILLTEPCAKFYKGTAIDTKQFPKTAFVASMALNDGPVITDSALERGYWEGTLVAVGCWKRETDNTPNSRNIGGKGVTKAAFLFDTDVSMAGDTMNAMTGYTIPLKVLDKAATTLDVKNSKAFLCKDAQACMPLVLLSRLKPGKH